MRVGRSGGMRTLCTHSVASSGAVDVFGRAGLLHVSSFAGCSVWCEVSAADRRVMPSTAGVPAML